MRCFLFILLFSLHFQKAYTDVIFTSERCNRVTYGLRTVNGDPSRYKQCGPSGRVWIVPCAPQMSFDPEDRVCKERSDSRTMKPMRKYEVSKNIITTPAPIPASYPVSAEAMQGSAPEEFVFSTIRPKSRKPKTRTRGKFKKTTTSMLTTPFPITTPMSTEILSEKSSEVEMTTTPKIVIFASKKNNVERKGGNLKQQLVRNRGGGGGGGPAFTRPGRVRTTTQIPVTHATRFVPGIHVITVAPKETQGMPHTLPPYEKMERIDRFEGVEDLTTITPEYTVRYNGQTMTENEFLNQLLHIVQHQKSVSERQQQDKFNKMEQERIRQEKEERVREIERRKQIEEAEKARQVELDRQAAIYAEQERVAMERERELERIRQEERKREIERIKQEEMAMEVARIRELERLQLERQQQNERARQELEAIRKQKILEEEERQRKIQMEKIRAEQEEARQREIIRLEEKRAREIERVMKEEEERQLQIERLRKKEEMRKLEEERLEMEERKNVMMEEERKRKIIEKEIAERQKAIVIEEERRKMEAERRKEKEIEERRQLQEQMRKATEERSRLEVMEQEREMMRQIIENERERAEMQRNEVAGIPTMTTIKPIYRPDISEYKPPDVESQMIRFTTQSPEWATPSPTWNPSWNTVTVEEESPNRNLITNEQYQCKINGECELKYDADSFCAHPSSSSMYLQCAPLYGRLGRWTERHCPDTLVFIVSIGRCEKGEEVRKPYDPDNRVVIPRLPSETSFVEWKGNRVIDHHIPNHVAAPRVYPPVPETHQPQIYNTIDEFPKDLLPRIPDVSPAETYAQQYQNHIHGSVVSGGQVRPTMRISQSQIPISHQLVEIPNVQFQNHAASNSIKSEIDLSHIHPLFPRVQPDFLSRILPSLNLKMHDEYSTGTQSLGSVVKPVLKEIALNQTEQFLDRLLADEILRQELNDRLKTSNAIESANPPL